MPSMRHIANCEGGGRVPTVEYMVCIYSYIFIDGVWDRE